jgi:hypothetical protein
VLGPKVLSIYSIHLISLFFLLYFLSIDFCNARLKKVGLSVVTQGQNVIRKRVAAMEKIKIPKVRNLPFLPYS